VSTARKPMKVFYLIRNGVIVSTASFVRKLIISGQHLNLIRGKNE